MAHITTRTSEYAFEARAEFATLAEAEAFAASFPKSYLVKAVEYRDYKVTPGSAFASCRYGFRDGNQTGENRAVRFMDKAEKLGHTIEHK